MVRLLSVCAFVFTLIPAVARAAGPTIQFTLPTLNATPSTFGTLPFPDDLYFAGVRQEELAWLHDGGNRRDLLLAGRAIFTDGV